jgi:hypothetical protein
MENSVHTEERSSSEDSDLVSQAGSDLSTADTHHQNTPQLWLKTTPSLRPYLPTCMSSQSQSFSIESSANTSPPLALSSEAMPEYGALSNWHGGSSPLGQDSGVGGAASQQFESAHTRPLSASPIVEPRGKRQTIKANERLQTCQGCLSEGASPLQQDPETAQHAGMQSKQKFTNGNDHRKKKEATTSNVGNESSDTGDSSCRADLMLEPVFTLMSL